MDVISTLSLTLGSSWLSGLNAYATVGILGLFGWAGWIDLPESLHPITHPLVFGTALFFYLVEFISDKIPAFDSFWDSIQTFIRIPVGAFLAYAAVGNVPTEWKIAATLAGGALALSAHATKSSLRATANMSPEPFSNWALSLSQDGFIVLCLYFMVRHPYIMLGILVVFLIFFIWFIPKIFRTFRWMWRKFVGLFHNGGRGGDRPALN